MSSKQEIYEGLQNLVNQAFSYAGNLDLGEERIEAFEFAEALRRLQRRGAACVMLAATNPLASLCDQDDEGDDEWDEDDD
ncbi:hypothetical protein NB694_000464 [Pantoea ananatis]|uniref:hypothetical protein n=1 Tax=Pantoea ananas TaxID=553 RepID=UPI0021F7C9A0|nr:hypothetical protein [Pantoea ananatis]MCW0310664.1 hypothetical protein [Pantoea ananatis]